MMKRSKICAAAAFILTLTLLIGIFSLAGCSFGDVHSTNPSENTVPTSESTSPPTQATEPSAFTAPTQPTTESPEATVPAEPSIPSTMPVVEHIIPDEFPDISTTDFDFQPPTLPIPAQDAPEEEWIAFFYGLFSPWDSWYGKMLTSYYAVPEAVDVGPFIYNGITNSGGPLTALEVAFLQEQGHPVLYMETYRTTAAELDALLQIYFGTTLEACKQVRTIRNTYFPETDSYYNSTTGPVDGGLTGIIRYRVLENGDYCIRYYRDWGTHRISEVVLRRKGNYFQLVSNLPVSEETGTAMLLYTPSDRPIISTGEDPAQPPVLPIPSEDASREEWIAFFYGLLSTRDSVYNRALFVSYEEPADILGTNLIDIANSAQTADLTDAEIAFLKDNESPYCRISKTELNDFLDVYFGTSLNSYQKKHLAQFVAFWDETDCYYLSRGDQKVSVTVSGILDYAKLDNGDYRVSYVAGYPGFLCTVVLHRTGDYFQIVSNQIVG